MTDIGQRSRVVIAGGGVAALETLAGLAKRIAGRAELMLVTPESSFVYRPASTARPFVMGRPREFPLKDVAPELGAQLVRDTIVLVDEDQGRVLTHDGDVIPFDALLLAVGTRLSWPRTDGIQWGRGDESAHDFADLLTDVEAGRVADVALVVPPGACWPVDAYELALILAAARASPDTRVRLVTAEQRPLECLGDVVSDAITTELEHAGVALTTDAQDLATLSCERAVSIPAAAGAHVDGVPHVAGGLIPVEPGGRVAGLQRTWAAGDCTAFAVKHALLAARQADVAVEQIAAAVEGRDAGDPPELRLHGVVVLPGRSLSGSVWVRPGEPLTHCLWWPPGRALGAHLARYLSTRDRVVRHGLVWHPHGLPVDVPVAPLGPAGAPALPPEPDAFEHDVLGRELMALARMERDSARRERRLEHGLRELERRQSVVIEKLEAAGYLHHDVTRG